MCGIAGIFLFNQDYSDMLMSVKEMTSVLSHRGPDDSGYFFDERVALGHRRLSIIDLSDNAKQPMFNEDHSLALVFNGEIYNFKELRKLLVVKGHVFKSSSDSEVLLHLYE
jgi:asparagine synthase (glutamine-hydrolysing)